MRKVRYITPEMNFIPQWYISNMKCIFQKTVDLRPFDTQFFKQRDQNKI